MDRIPHWHKYQDRKCSVGWKCLENLQEKNRRIIWQSGVMLQYLIDLGEKASQVHSMATQHKAEETASIANIDDTIELEMICCKHLLCVWELNCGRWW